MLPRPASLFLALAAAGAQASDPERGRLLYENFCHHCHLTEIHFRVASKIGGWEQLLRTVKIWEEEMGLDWREEEAQDVASYLNARYYGFAVASPSAR